MSQDGKGEKRNVRFRTEGRCQEVGSTANGTDGISHVSRSVRETGDDEEHRDEVLAVSSTPVYYEEPGHEVSERGLGRNEVE
jgi:hypothetical protein